MEDLKAALIQLGEDRPELRPHLRKILDWVCAQGGEAIAPEVSVPDKQTVGEGRPLPTPKSEEGAFFVASPHATEAFNTVLLPQIQAQLDSASFDDISKMMEEVKGLGSSARPELENALIVFKPISMNTRRYYQEVQKVFENWIRPKLKGESGGGSSEGGGGDGKKEYNFNFS